MAYFRGNASFSRVSADDLRTPWVPYVPAIIEGQPYASFESPDQDQAAYYKLRHKVIISLDLRITFETNTPDYTREVHITLPEGISLKEGVVFESPIIIERLVLTGVERVFSNGILIFDGQTTGGLDGNTLIYTNRVRIQTFGMFSRGVTYVIRGQGTFQPAY